jgi:hypothetical protein
MSDGCRAFESDLFGSNQATTYFVCNGKWPLWSVNLMKILADPPCSLFCEFAVCS